MKILVTGSKGQLGNELIRMLNTKASTLGNIGEQYSDSHVLGVDIDDLDIVNITAVRSFFRKFKPDIVINCAAFTNVDLCESMKEDAFKVNVIGPRNLAICAQEINAKLVHISTDYVYRGDAINPYTEYDVACPQSVYGLTKLQGENYVKEFCSRYFIIRTAWLYGYHGKNFVKTILRTAKEKGYLRVVDDQIGTPTNAEDLAYHILKVLLTDEYGIYHCTGNGQCSWHEFATRIVEYSHISCKVDPSKSSELNRAAKRPSYSVLDNMMLRCTVGDDMRHWEEALSEFISRLDSMEVI